MENKDSQKSKYHKLRKQAEDLLQKEPQSANIPSDVFDLVHELKIHQIELEHQNDELNRAQKELTHLYHEYENLYESAPCGYITLDSRSKISRVNYTTEEIMGTTKTRMRGKLFSDFLPDKRKESFFEVQRKAAQSGEKRSIELPLNNNPPLWVQLDISVDRNSKQEVNQWKLVLIDITKRKEIEFELQNANATKDKLFNILAHDLKAPFNGILGFTELLLLNINSYDKEKIMEYANVINKSTHEAFNLLNNLLDWARAQTGRISFNPSHIGVKNIIKEIMTQMTGAAKNKIIYMNYELPEDFTVFADEDMLRTILRNLVSNAIKYTKENGEINITAERNNSETRFAVSDTGIGMSGEYARNLFKFGRYSSLDGTAKEKGTGLGLLLCKEFVNRHNGSIWAESSEGEGSTFTFTVPNEPK